MADDKKKPKKANLFVRILLKNALINAQAEYNEAARKQDQAEMARILKRVNILMQQIAIADGNPPV